MLKYIFIPIFIFLQSYNIKAIDQAKFYNAFSGSSLEKVNVVIAELEKEQNTITKNAYMGAILMKKAGLVKPLLQKLNLFKEGHGLLEEAIKRKPQNVEYRFLRFVIQENAPLILNYKSNIEEDKNCILNNFNSITKNLKLVIVDYIKLSKELTEKDLG